MKPLLSKEEIAELLAPLDSDNEQNQAENGSTPSTESCLQLRAETGSVQITRTELQQLKKGSIVLLEQPADNPLNLYIDNQLVASGVLLKVKGKLAVKVTEVSLSFELPGKQT